MKKASDRRVRVIVGLGVGALLFGCETRVLTPSPNDAYRDQIRELQEKLEAANAKNAELTKSLELAQRASTAPTPLDAEAAAEAPRATRLAVAWGSAVERDRADPTKAVLTLYLEPLDARGRFVQVSGQLTVAVVSVPLPGQGEPMKLGDRVFSPKQLRDQWRSGLTGTHYTIDVPMDLSHAAGVQAAAVSVELREGSATRPLTGALVLDLTKERSRTGE